MASFFTNGITIPNQGRGIDIQLSSVKVINPVKKPGPVFNAVARHAYYAGADFFYRVNDDTEFAQHWPRAYVRKLMSLTEPYGCIGPSSVGLGMGGLEGNRILTHDFVHRTHMEVFNKSYYPDQLQDWFMDDWISHVYGYHRTFLSKRIRVIHHNDYHSRRYVVNNDTLQWLMPLIIDGVNRIYAWMLQQYGAHYVSEDIRKDFLADAERTYQFKHNEHFNRSNCTKSGHHHKVCKERSKVRPFQYF